MPSSKRMNAVIFEQRDSSLRLRHIPLSSLYVATALRGRLPDANVKIIPAHVPVNEALEHVKKADVVMLSRFSLNEKGRRDYAKILRHVKGKTVVLGGWGPTMKPRETSKKYWAKKAKGQLVMRGTWGEALHTLQGVAHLLHPDNFDEEELKKHPGLLINGKIDTGENPNALEITPAQGKLEEFGLNPDDYKSEDAMLVSLQVNAPCSHSFTKKACTFCSFAARFHETGGYPLKLRSVEALTDELEQIKSVFGNQLDIFLRDPDLSKKALDNVLTALKRAEIDYVAIGFENRADTFLRMVKHLPSSTAWFPVIGAEYMDQEMLDLVSKGTTVEENRLAVKKIFKLAENLSGRGAVNLILSHPRMTEKMLENNLANITDLIKNAPEGVDFSIGGWLDETNVRISEQVVTPSHAPKLRHKLALGLLALRGKRIEDFYYYGPRGRFANASPKMLEIIRGHISKAKEIGWHKAEKLPNAETEEQTRHLAGLINGLYCLEQEVKRDVKWRKRQARKSRA